MGGGSRVSAGILIWVSILAGRASAGIHQVWDEAHFLQVTTVERADPILDEIHSRFGRDLMIETFPSIPDDFKARYREQGRRAFYDGWSNAEGRRLELNGILILITGEPAHLEVVVGTDTRTRDFTDADRAELVQRLVASFHAKAFDDGILQAVVFVRDRMARNRSAAATPATQPTTRESETP